MHHAVSERCLINPQPVTKMPPVAAGTAVVVTRRRDVLQDVLTSSARCLLCVATLPGLNGSVRPASVAGTPPAHHDEPGPGEIG